MRYLQILIAAMILAVSNFSYAQCGGPVPVMCDADGDRDVDFHDIQAIADANGTPAGPGDMRDVNGDGMITILDAEQCAASCDLAECADPDGTPTGKPNILILMVDDLGFNDLAINNDNTDIDTPKMDQIARDGVRFTRHYAAAVCSPARAAFLTGMYPERVGYQPNALGISPEYVTLPERLGEEGYTTWHIGKWHIGDLERTAWPDYQGFDHWFGFLSQFRLEGAHVDGELIMTHPTYTDPWLEGDTEPGRNFTGHLENILTDKAIEVLSELHVAQAPWFLNLWFFAPHGPVEPASEFAALYPDTAAGRYQALVNQLDTNIGRIVLHLETLGALQNTIIVVVSDNGGTNIALDNNAPYSGKKAEVTEGGLRTPLIIQWTDEALNGQVYSDIVSIEDIYPTLMAAIDVPPPVNLDGNSFYNSVAQTEPALQKDRFNELAGDTYSGLSTDGRWRLYQPGPIWGFLREPRLYDLEMDPTATVWVLPPPEAQLTLMLDSYQAWYREVHTVKTEYLANENGGGVLKGMSFMRTPGFQNYTFGIGISDDFEGQIATQNGIWEISRTGNTVMAQYGDLILSGDVDNSNSCHSLVITGMFGRQVWDYSLPDQITLSLYIDGIEAQSDYIESTLLVPDPTVETIIGDPDNPAQTGTVGEPVILNVSLDRLYSPWTAESFGQEICNTN